MLKKLSKKKLGLEVSKTNHLDLDQGIKLTFVN